MTPSPFSDVEFALVLTDGGLVWRLLDDLFMLTAVDEDEDGEEDEEEEEEEEAGVDATELPLAAVVGTGPSAEIFGLTLVADDVPPDPVNARR